MTRTDSRSRSLSEWFRDWQQPLRRFLARRRLGSAADIDDIAQEVFLRLLRYDRTELVDHPRAYLLKIAANVSSEWVMRSSQRLPHDSAWLAELVEDLSPEAETERDDLEERVRAAVQTLAPRAQEILRLHFGEGKTHPEIAAALGISRKIVKRDSARAYAALRVNLDQDSRAQGRQGTEKAT